MNEPKAHPCAIRLRSQAGIALPLALLLATAIAALTMVVATGARIETEIARNDVNSKRALAAAEAGLNHAFSVIAAGDEDLNDELSNDGTGGTLVALGGTVSVNGPTYRFTQFGGADPDDGYYVRAVDNWDEASGTNVDTVDLDRSINLRSIGRVANAERRIQALIHLSLGPECALVFDGDLVINGNPSVQGEQACVHANDNFDIPGRPRIDGGAYSAQTLDIDGRPELEGTRLNSTDEKNAYAASHSNQDTVQFYAVNPFSFGPDGIDLVAAIHAAGGLRFDANGTIYNSNSAWTCTSTPPDYCTGGDPVTNKDLRGNGAWQQNPTPPMWSRPGQGPDVEKPIFVEGSIAIPEGNGSLWRTTIVALNSINATGDIDITRYTGTGDLRNLVLVSGNDIKLAGDATFGTQTEQGAILAHQQIVFAGNPTVYGYVAAGNGDPTWTGDPAPDSTSAWDLASNPSDVAGNPTIIYDGLSTVFFPNTTQVLSWSSIGTW